MKKVITILLFFLTVIVIGCSREEVSQEEEVRTVPVRVMTVKKGSVRKLLSYVGDIKGQEEIVVYSKVSGKLIENRVMEGDKVKKNDVLALLDRDEVGFKFEKSPVTSPIEGIVGSVYLDRGAHIMPSSDMSSGTPVFLIVDMNVMRVMANVIERDLPEVRKGQTAEVRVDAYPDEVFKGVVERVSPVVALDSRTASVEITIPNQDHRLKPGMFGRIQIIIDEHSDVPVIPFDVVVEDEGSDYVFILDGNEVSRRKVVLGISRANRVEILEGVEYGEELVIVGQKNLQDGSRVEVIEGDI